MFERFIGFGNYQLFEVQEGKLRKGGQWQ